jgi:hypothetical protein
LSAVKTLNSSPFVLDYTQTKSDDIIVASRAWLGGARVVGGWRCKSQEVRPDAGQWSESTKRCDTEKLSNCGSQSMCHVPCAPLLVPDQGYEMPCQLQGMGQDFDDENGHSIEE